MSELDRLMFPIVLIRRSHATLRRSSAQPMCPIVSWHCIFNLARLMCELDRLRCPIVLIRRSHANFSRSSAQPMCPIVSWHCIFNLARLMCELDRLRCPIVLIRRSHATLRRSSAQPMCPIVSWHLHFQSSPSHVLNWTVLCSLLFRRSSALWQTVPCKLQTVQCTASVPYRIMRLSHANLSLQCQTMMRLG